MAALLSARIQPECSDTCTHWATVPRVSHQCHLRYLGSTNIWGLQTSRALETSYKGRRRKERRQRKEGEEAEKGWQWLSEELYPIPWPRPVPICCVNASYLKDISILTQALPIPDFWNVWEAQIWTARLSLCTWCSSYQHTALAQEAEHRCNSY